MALGEAVRSSRLKVSNIFELGNAGKSRKKMGIYLPI